MINVSDIPIGIQVINSEMQYVFLNDLVLRQVGKTLDEHIGKKMEEVYPGIEGSEIYSAIQSCHLNGTAQVVHNEYILPNGQLSYWELDIKKTGDDVMIFSRDITKSEDGEKLLLNQISD